MQVPLNAALEAVQGLKVGVFLAQDVVLPPPGQPRAGLVGDEFLERHGEDVVELLERALLGLGHEEEDHHEGHDVQAAEKEALVGRDKEEGESGTYA